jgi:prepilin signal peptidase PulO-like enzyme (type II secretory pathway)
VGTVRAVNFEPAVLAVVTVPLSAVVASAVVLCVAGLTGGSFLARFSARRSVAQPLVQEPDAEQALIAHVLGRPDSYAVVAELTPSDFCMPAHALVWQAVEQVCGADKVRAAIKQAGLDEVKKLPTDDVIAKLSAGGRTIEADDVLAAVTEAVSGDDTAVAVIETAAEATVEGDGLGAEALLGLGEKVAVAGDDRGRLNGSGMVEENPDGPLPLRRVYTAPTHNRAMATIVGCGLGFGLAPVFALSAYPDSTGGWALAVASLIALTVTSVVVGLVDLDTFYLDLTTFLPGAAVAWAFAAAAAVMAHDASRLIPGVIIVVGIAVFLEVSNRVYKLVRGIDGMGFGDTIIILATSGVPSALVGSVALGFQAMLAGMIISIIVHLATMRKNGLDAQTPFAFGPYLAVGWPVAWALTLAAGALFGF